MEGWLAREFQSDLYGGEDVRRSDMEIALRFVKLADELLQLRAKLALELEEFPDGFGVFLGAAGVQLAAVAEHGFFDLMCDDRADFTEVLADGLDLEGGAGEELEVGFELAGSGAGGGGIEALTDEMEDADFLGLLSVAIHATIALLHANGIPWDLVVDEV